jgi:hypothetical protein
VRRSPLPGHARRIRANPRGAAANQQRFGESRVVVGVVRRHQALSEWELCAKVKRGGPVNPF